MRASVDDFTDADWTFASKWSTEIAKLGFTPIPNALLMCARDLGLKSTEFFILVNIESFRWDSSRNPFPSQKLLADRIGASVKTVSRNIQSLQDKGCIRPLRRVGTSNEYDLEPLIAQLSRIPSNRIRLNGTRQIREYISDIYDPKHST